MVPPELLPVLDQYLRPNTETLTDATAQGQIMVVAHQAEGPMLRALGLMPGTEGAILPMSEALQQAMTATAPDVVARWFEGGAPGRVFVVYRNNLVPFNVRGGVWEVDPPYVELMRSSVN